MAARNPTFHTMETEKIAAVAQQAAVNEDMEQRRRLLDTQGERQRKLNANKISQSLNLSERSLRHVPYPVAAPLFLRTERSLLQDSKLAMNTAINTLENTTAKVASTISNATAEVGYKTAGLAAEASYSAAAFGQKTADLASEVGQSAAALGHKTADLATSFSQIALDALSNTYNKATQVASNVANTTSDLAHDASNFATETYAEYKPKVVDTAHLIQKKATDAAFSASEIALVAKDKLVHLADDITFSTTKAYAVALMEAERRRRMLSVDEQYAIINARNASAVIKGLGFEYYRQFGQRFTYTLTLLEEHERAWRMLSPNASLGKINANKTALLITRGFATVTPPCPTSITQEIKIEELAPIAPLRAYGTPTL